MLDDRGARQDVGAPREGGGPTQNEAALDPFRCPTSRRTSHAHPPVSEDGLERMPDGLLVKRQIVRHCREALWVDTCHTRPIARDRSNSRIRKATANRANPSSA